MILVKFFKGCIKQYKLTKTTTFIIITIICYIDNTKRIKTVP